ncbi:hypothetical protein ARGLB_037_00970 [Arthrobacter globiformis NBRC 12137]|uniref:Uncharacterized protein n=1 Tax=Arthrobacter globiformis (strain ATCC 8010 / DSM 20124 / JCM 1332 / NBRC 12137 / NCIMB 8907 / NRRL B-2979 / 168) TaxID=1077972 RepID=H0QK06_ARTG1|nr:hypothetical protein [Arthrobacter globiformis]GAB13246.1 hypothetical protein ARGLB_037_00970 [Arthrobacter globiformis NBRC 12137]
MELTTVTREDLDNAAAGLNGRLRKIGWKALAQAFHHCGDAADLHRNSFIGRG